MCTYTFDMSFIVIFSHVIDDLILQSQVMYKSRYLLNPSVSMCPHYYIYICIYIRALPGPGTGPGTAAVNLVINLLTPSTSINVYW